MNIKKTNDIWYFTEPVKDGEDTYKIGYYYVDETSRLVGPYETLNEAREMKFANDKILEQL